MSAAAATRRNKTFQLVHEWIIRIKSPGFYTRKYGTSSKHNSRSNSSIGSSSKLAAETAAANCILAPATLEQITLQMTSLVGEFTVAYVLKLYSCKDDYLLRLYMCMTKI